MKEKLTQLLQEGKDRIDAVRSEAELQEVKALLLGKQGSLTGLLKELPKLDAALRPEMGKAVNQAKAQLTALLEQSGQPNRLFSTKSSKLVPQVGHTTLPRTSVSSSSSSSPRRPDRSFPRGNSPSRMAAY